MGSPAKRQARIGAETAPITASCAFCRCRRGVEAGDGHVRSQRSGTGAGPPTRWFGRCLSLMSRPTWASRLALTDRKVLTLGNSPWLVGGLFPKLADLRERRRQEGRSKT
jgi:hypothetical protein